MKLLILACCIGLPVFPQAIPQWFVNDMASNHASQVNCDKPGNVAQNGQLVITAKAQSVTCGDQANPLAPFSYTSGMVMMNAFNFQYGVIQFSVTTPVGQGTPGLWPAVWMEGSGNTPSSGGQGCQGVNKLGWQSSATQGYGPSGTAICNWPHPGSDEIDMFEMLGTTQIDQAIHMTAGNNVGFTGAAAGTTYVIRCNWTASAVTFFINGVQTYSYTNTVPSSYMFIMVTFDLGGTAGNPSGQTWPQTLGLQYMHVCPVGTVTCDQAHASCGPPNCFDEEFGGTGPLSSVYVGENFAGNGTGLNTSDVFGVLNNQQVSWPNDPGYCTNGQIGPGTTLNLVGTITTTLIANCPGTSGSPITYNFLAGSSGTVNTNGQSFINVVGPPSTAISGAITVSGNVAIH